MSRSRESFDIADQVRSEFKLSGLPLSESRHNSSRDKGHKLPLGVELTGYRLLNVAVILAFGISKAVSSYHGGSAIPTALDLVGGTLLAAILYYIGLLQDNRPEICPLFFQVDWAPPVLRFIRRYAGANYIGLTVHRFLLSLSPVQPAVTLLQIAQEVREAPPFQIGSRYFELSASSSIIIRNATMVATVWIILSALAALQHLMIVVYRIRALHSFLAQDIIWLSLLVVWAASQVYTNLDVSIIKYVPTDRIDEDHDWATDGTSIGTIATMGHVVTTAPIILLLESVEFKNASRLLQLMERRAALQRLTEQLPIVVQFTKRILWGLYLVALMVTLARNIKEPYYVLNLCIMVIVFSRHFLTSLPTPWRSTIDDVQKTARSVAQRAGSGAWDYSLYTGGQV